MPVAAVCVEPKRNPEHCARVGDEGGVEDAGAQRRDDPQCAEGPQMVKKSLASNELLISSIECLWLLFNAYSCVN